MELLRLETDHGGNSNSITKEFMHRVFGREWRYRNAWAICVLLAAAGALPAVYAAAQNTAPVIYRTAASIMALSPEEAARGYPVELRGVVTKPREYGLSMQDPTSGTWVHLDQPMDFSAGDEIEVKGVVDMGQFSPRVMAQSVKKLGRAPLPRPTPVTSKQLSTGDWDQQYVTVTGAVRSVELRPRVRSSERLWLKIATADGSIDCALPEQYLDAANKLIDAVVRIDAVGSSAKTPYKQITTPVLSVASISNLTVLKPPPKDLFAEPLTPIGRLMQYRSGTDFDHRVRIAGTVTYYKSGESLILEDAGSALLVMTTQTGDIKPGDRVEALGFPAPKDSGPYLQDAMIRYIASGPPPHPRPVPIADILSGSLNNNLVSVEGHLLRRVREPSREVFLLQNGSNLLVAELRNSTDSTASQFPQDGSVVRLSGVSILEVEGSWHMGGPTAGSVNSILLIRSPADMQVLQPPSWWTTLHVMYIAVALGFLVLAFLALIVYARMERWRLQAVFDERERLANEMHDTLAQSFAGLGFQLQAISKEIPNDIPRLRQQVDLARALVRHSHKEARCSIEPLDPDSPEAGNWIVLLEGSARRMVEGGSVQINIKITGEPVSLPPETAISLLRIGQEAVANAIRHADPSQLDIAITFEETVVRLSIQDDGCGFIKSGDLLGFGLRGMRKRSAAISARLEITSNPGQGTSVEVVSFLPPSPTISGFFKRVWDHSRERILHVDSKTN